MLSVADPRKRPEQRFGERFWALAFAIAVSILTAAGAGGRSGLAWSILCGSAVGVSLVGRRCPSTPAVAVAVALTTTSGLGLVLDRTVWLGLGVLPLIAAVYRPQPRTVADAIAQQRREVHLGSAIRVGTAVGVCAAAVVLWWMAGRSGELARVGSWIAPLSLFSAAAAVALFSALNALAEEWVWRVVLFDDLQRAGWSRRWTVLLSGLSFGLAHFNGIPSGATGVVLASVFGICLGTLRLRASVLACFMGHFVADLLIGIGIYWIVR